jgi:hypothetical protein
MSGACQRSPLQAGWLDALGVVIELCGQTGDPAHAAQLATLVEVGGRTQWPPAPGL